MARDTRLTVRLEDDELVIRIGTESLRVMTEIFPPFEHEFVVADPAEWAREIVDILKEPQDESLKTLVEEMFERAIDAGYAGDAQSLEYVDPDQDRDDPD